MPTYTYLNHIMVSIYVTFQLVECTHGTSGALCLEWRQKRRKKRDFPFFPFLLFILLSPRRVGVELGVVHTNRSHNKACLAAKDQRAVRDTLWMLSVWMEKDFPSHQGTVISTPLWQQAQAPKRAGGPRPDSSRKLKAALQAPLTPVLGASRQWARHLLGTSGTC